MKRDLPIFRAKVRDDETLGVDAIALVENPAIERNFLAFNKSIKFAIESETKRMVTGALMIANLPIYRYDPQIGEYYIVFEDDVIEDIAIRFAKNKFNDSVNEEHDPIRKIEGCTLFESWIVNKDQGKRAPKGFSGISDGSWFGTYKIENDEVWAKVQSGEFLGFSVEGTFDLEYKTDEKESIIDLIVDAIGKLK